MLPILDKFPTVVRYKERCSMHRTRHRSRLWKELACQVIILQKLHLRQVNSRQLVYTEVDEEQS